MKICALSDLHGYLPDPKSFEQCDVICICGDILPLASQRNTLMSGSWLVREFMDWVKELPCRKVVLVAGNHDFFFEVYGPNSDIEASQLQYELFGPEHRNPKIEYLCDSSVTIDGVKFYGTPWCPALKNWAFYANSSELMDIYSNIPSDTDILLTHCPPKVSDVGMVLQKDNWNFQNDFGSIELANILIDRPNIKWVFSGHVHTGSHEPRENMNKTKCVNVSIKNEDYMNVFKPFYTEV